MKTNQILIKWLFVISVIYQFILIINSDILRLGFRIGGLAIIIALIVLNIDKNYKVGYFIAFLVFTTVIFSNILIYEVALTMAELVTVLQLCLGLLAITFCDKLSITKDTMRFLYYAITISLLGCVILSFISSMYIWGSDGRAYLTLGYNNPNFTGIVLFIQLGVFLSAAKENGNKFFNLLLMIITAYLLYMTRSRTAFIASCGIIIYSFFNANIKLPKFVVAFCCLLPIVFVRLYLWLYNLGLENFEVFGKSFFSGRQDTYQEYLAPLDTPFKMLFGNMGAYIFTNAHNAPLAFVVSTGIVGMVCAYYMYIRPLFETRQRNSVSSNFAVIVILACFIHSCAEAGLFLAGFPALSYMIVLYIIMSSEIVDEKKTLKHK